MSLSQFSMNPFQDNICYLINKQIDYLNHMKSGKCLIKLSKYQYDILSDNSIFNDIHQLFKQKGYFTKLVKNNCLMLQHIMSKQRRILESHCPKPQSLTPADPIVNTNNLFTDKTPNHALKYCGAELFNSHVEIWKNIISEAKKNNFTMISSVDMEQTGQTSYWKNVWNIFDSRPTDIIHKDFLENHNQKIYWIHNIFGLGLVSYWAPTEIKTFEDNDDAKEYSFSINELMKMTHFLQENPTITMVGSNEFPFRNARNKMYWENKGFDETPSDIVHQIMLQNEQTRIFWGFNDDTQTLCVSFNEFNPKTIFLKSIIRKIPNYDAFTMNTILHNDIISYYNFVLKKIHLMRDYNDNNNSWIITMTDFENYPGLNRAVDFRNYKNPNLSPQSIISSVFQKFGYFVSIDFNKITIGRHTLIINKKSNIDEQLTTHLNLETFRQNSLQTYDKKNDEEKSINNDENILESISSSENDDVEEIDEDDDDYDIFDQSNNEDGHVDDCVDSLDENSSKLTTES
jgi:hypothetical protein